MQPYDVGSERLQWRRPGPRDHSRLPVDHLDHIGLERIFSLDGVKQFQPVHGGFDQICGDARRASVELVGDQDSAFRARMWCPPPDAVWRIGSEVGKDQFA
jgi:hypothetical protein